MQSSLWKLLTVVGIIGIGTLVVLEVQSRLPMPDRASQTADSVAVLAADGIAGNDVIPDATTDLDAMLSGAETFDDADFALQEPASVSNSGSGEPSTGVQSPGAQSTGGQAFVGVTPVNRTVRKDTLTDDENPFNREPAASGDPATESAPVVAAPQANSRTVIQPTSFVSSSPAANSAIKSNSVTTANTSKTANTSPTMFFSGSGGTNAAADVQTSNAADSSVAVRTAETITTSGNNTAVANTQVDSEIPDLFVPDPLPELGGPQQPSVPAAKPDDDLPLMETPGFDADPLPSFDPEPKPVSPTNPRPDFGTPLSNPGGNGNSPSLPSDENVRFFEPDEPVPTPPADNGGSRPEPRRDLPPAFELDPVPDLDRPRTVPPRTLPDTTTQPEPRSTPLPAPRDPREDDFPTPSYPDRNTRPDINSSPFDSPPRRPIESTDPRDLPAISDRPTRPDRERDPGLRDFPGTSPNGVDRETPEVMRPQLTIQKRAPDQATVGVSHEYTILVSNDGDSPAYDVVVDDYLGDSARLENSKPTAEFDRATGKLKWTIAELAPRARQEILVRITPTGEGTLDGIATVRFKAQVKTATVITAPKITLEVTGPAEVKVGDEVQLRYVIRNNGTGDARNVILRSVLPPGLKHSEGGDLEYEIDNLRAGDREEIDLTVIAAEPGSLRTVSEVTMSGVSADRATSEIDIIGSQLSIQRLGPDRRYVGRTATFQNIVVNETNFEATNAIVTEQIPEGMRFISADNGGEYNAQTGRIRWAINRLLPHKQAVLQVELEAVSAGPQQTVVEVAESAGFRSQAMENTVVTVQDYENMTADISRQDAPVAVGETFGFTITIENRGTAVARGVEMVVNVPSEISVKAAGTRTNPARRIGNSVHYAVVESIQAGEKMAFELKLQGDRPAQNALVRASLKYEHLTEPLIATESVTIFE